MEKQKFKDNLKEELSLININVNDNQLELFYAYMMLLLDWNEKINLTAITEPKDIITKHFVDSCTASKYIKGNSYIVDCGTGAGFPGIPLAIIRQDLKFVLFDSLNKRINFLNEAIQKLGLKSIETIHTRAEDLAYNKTYREQFDFAISRAVANMSTLLEYLLPFCKKDGCAICMKGSNIEEELDGCKKTLRMLNGKIENIDKFVLPKSDIIRHIVTVRKTGIVPQEFPRRQNKPAKNPLG